MVKGSIKPDDLDGDIFDATKNTLLKGVSKGFKTDFNEISYDQHDYSLLTKFRTNIYNFAGAKTYQQLKAYNDMLIGANGQVVSFEHFKKNVAEYRKEALKIDKQYNETWLQTEYNTALRSSEMGRQWGDIINNADIFPNLTYITVGDEHVRISHRVLNDITLPINNAFWRKHYPPNDWGCRCRVEQNNNPVTEGEIPNPEQPVMFDNNVGISGNPFYKHPYYERNGINFNDVVDKAGNFSLNEQIEMNRKVWNDYGNRPTFKQVNFNTETGGFYVEHIKAETMKQGEQQAIDKLVMLGKRVEKPAFSDKAFEKHSDILVNGSAFDVKTTTGAAKTITDHIVKGATQARNLYVSILNYKKKDAIEGINEGFKKIEKYQVNAMLLNINNEVYTLTYWDWLAGLTDTVLP